MCAVGPMQVEEEVGQISEYVSSGLNSSLRQPLLDNGAKQAFQVDSLSVKIVSA